MFRGLIYYYCCWSSPALRIEAPKCIAHQISRLSIQELKFLNIFKLELGFYKPVWPHLKIKLSRYNMDKTSYANFEIYITVQQLTLSMFHIQRDVSTQSCSVTRHVSIPWYENQTVPVARIWCQVLQSRQERQRILLFQLRVKNRCL